MLTRRRAIALGAGAATSFFGLGGYAFGMEPLVRLRVQRYALKPAGWPDGLRLRVAALTDIHAGGVAMPISRVKEIVAETNALKPDIVVLLGDFVAAHDLDHIGTAERCTAELGALRAPLGVHAILGNHDWWDDSAAQRTRRGPVASQRGLSKVGVPVYENEAVRLETPSGPFWLVGLGDQIAFRTRRRHGFDGRDDLAGALRGVRDDAPVILLAHEPDIFPEVPSRVALTLSGHTHGGQVRVLGYSPIVPSIYGNRYAYGHVEEEGRHLVVSGGLGTGFLPVRFGVPPEIVEVTLG